MAVAAASVKPVPTSAGSSCWGVWWAFLACVAGILLAVFWTRIVGAVKAGWSKVRGLFKRSPKP